MEMVAPVPVPVPAVDFNLDSTCASPYMTAPSSPKSNHHEDFEFNFSGQLERASLSADELFDSGMIRPCYQHLSSAVSSPQRGRETTACISLHKKSRSLSPLRVCDIMLDEETSQKTSNNPKSSYVSSILACKPTESGS
ncbi:hypothetical protein GQ457_15G013880 [Hibiscus cannabinus]